jgi:hypothetical protein
MFKATLSAIRRKLGEPRWYRARFVLDGSDRPGVCAGLTYAGPPGSGRCHRQLLASWLSRRLPRAHATRVGKHRVVVLAGPGFEGLDRYFRER